MKKEARNQKKSLNAYELLLKLPTNVKSIPLTEEYHVSFLYSHLINEKCPFCQKAFSEIHFLQNHVNKRHKEQHDQLVSHQAQTNNFAPFPVASINSTQSVLRPQAIDDTVAEEMRTMKDFLLSEAEQIKSLKVKLEGQITKQKESLQMKELELEKQQHQQQLKYEEELRTFQAVLRKEFLDQKASLMQEERRLEELRAELQRERELLFASSKPSGLSSELKSDTEDDKRSKALPLKDTSKQPDKAVLQSDSNQYREDILKLQQEYIGKVDEMHKQAEIEQQRSKQLRKVNERLIEEIARIREEKEEAKKIIPFVTYHVLNSSNDENAKRKKHKREHSTSIVNLEDNSEIELTPSGTCKINSRILMLGVPFQNKPFLTSMYNHTTNDIEKYRKHIHSELKRQLKSYNISDLQKKLSQQLFAENLQVFTLIA